jgi:hypothetical protein
MFINWIGIKTGIAAFLLIGVFHVIVVKAEYYFSKKIWPLFLLVGLFLLVLSLGIPDDGISSIIAIAGISCLWSIKELFEQEKRVEKGWFPSNPKRKKI